MGPEEPRAKRVEDIPDLGSNQLLARVRPMVPFWELSSRMKGSEEIRDTYQLRRLEQTWWALWAVSKLANALTSSGRPILVKNSTPQALLAIQAAWAMSAEMFSRKPGLWNLPRDKGVRSLARSLSLSISLSPSSLSLICMYLCIYYIYIYLYFSLSSHSGALVLSFFLTLSLSLSLSFPLALFLYIYMLRELGSYILRDTPKPWQLKAGPKPTIKQLKEARKGNGLLRKENRWPRQENGPPPLREQTALLIVVNAFNCNGSPHGSNCWVSYGAPKTWPKYWTPARVINMHTHIYICCGVIIWAKFGLLRCHYLGQVCILQNTVCQKHYKIGVSALCFWKKSCARKFEVSLSGPSWPSLSCSQLGPDNDTYLAQIMTPQNGFFSIFCF